MSKARDHEGKTCLSQCGVGDGEESVGWEGDCVLRTVRQSAYRRQRY